DNQPLARRSPAEAGGAGEPAPLDTRGEPSILPNSFSNTAAPVSRRRPPRRPLWGIRGRERAAGAARRGTAVRAGAGGPTEIRARRCREVAARAADGAATSHFEGNRHVARRRVGPSPFRTGGRVDL